MQLLVYVKLSLKFDTVYVNSPPLQLHKDECGLPSLRKQLIASSIFSLQIINNDKEHFFSIEKDCKTV